MSGAAISEKLLILGIYTHFLMTQFKHVFNQVKKVGKRFPRSIYEPFLEPSNTFVFVQDTKVVMTTEKNPMCVKFGDLIENLKNKN